MFGIDVEKLLVVAVIALVVIGPKELPMVMRSVGRIVRKATSVRDEIQRQLRELVKMDELDAVGRDLDQLGRSASLDFANNPAIAVRGSLPGEETGVAREAITDELAYASPEMRAYLAPEESPSAKSSESAT
jgi:sec-independent protein translocase protein TatB